MVKTLRGAIGHTTHNFVTTDWGRSCPAPTSSRLTWKISGGGAAVDWLTKTGPWLRDPATIDKNVVVEAL